MYVLTNYTANRTDEDVELIIESIDDERIVRRHIDKDYDNINRQMVKSARSSKFTSGNITAYVIAGVSVESLSFFHNNDTDELRCIIQIYTYPDWLPTLLPRIKERLDFWLSVVLPNFSDPLKTVGQLEDVTERIQAIRVSAERVMPDRLVEAISNGRYVYGIPPIPLIEYDSVEIADMIISTNHQLTSPSTYYVSSGVEDDEGVISEMILQRISDSVIRISDRRRSEDITPEELGSPLLRQYDYV